MPVMVTGAETALGAEVVARLRSTGGELRAFVAATADTGDVVSRLRTAGCKVAVGDLDDEGHLEAALEQVHTVAHCWTGPLLDPGAQVEAAATLCSAALGAGVRRLIWVTELVAVPAGDGARANPYLAAARDVRALFDTLPIEVVTLATALRYGDDTFTERLRAGWLSGTGADPAAPHAPVHLRDVAHAVAAADRQRGSGRELHVEMALVGPERRTLGEFLGALGAPPLGAAPPADMPAPEPWLVEWLSDPPWERALAAEGAPTVAHGASRLPIP